MTERATVAACLIVKDGEATIRAAIESLRNHVDEVCALDTGSTDATLAILEELAAEPGAPIRIASAPWADDFGAARQASFDMASADYVLWADDDEWMEGGENLRELLASDMDGLWVRLHDIIVAGGLEGRAWSVRVARRGAGAWWQSPVHERLQLPQSARVGAVRPSALRFVHRSVDTSGRHDHRALVDRSVTDHPRLTHFAARHLLDDGEPARAAAMLTAYLDETRRVPGSRFDTDYVRSLEVLLGAKVMLGDTEGVQEAWAERLDTLDAWRCAADAGNLSGPAAAFAALERFDVEEITAGGDRDELNRFLKLRGLLQAEFGLGR